MTLYEIIEQSYALANGALAVTHFFTGALDIPDHRESDINRYEIAAKIGTGAQFAGNNSIVRVRGAAGSNAYQDLRLMVNRGAGTVSPDYARVEAEAGSTGAVIARKTAVRGARTSSVVWAEQFALGPYTGAGLWFASDGQQTAVDHIAVVQSSLDVTASLLQWNRSVGTTGDYVRVVKPDSSYAFRITNDGDIIWGRDESLRAELAALRTEVAQLRAQVQALSKGNAK